MFLTSPDYLTQGKWRYVHYVAQERLKRNKTVHHESRYGPKIEVIGAAAELAARRYLGLPQKLHLDFDRGTDFVYHNWKLDIKGTEIRDYTHLEKLSLQWPYYKPIRSDIAMMLGVNLKECYAVIIGWVWSNNIRKRDINGTRLTPCREVPCVELKNIEVLKDIFWKSQRREGLRTNQLFVRR